MPTPPGRRRPRRERRTTRSVSAGPRPPSRSAPPPGTASRPRRRRDAIRERVPSSSGDRETKKAPSNIVTETDIFPRGSRSRFSSHVYDSPLPRSFFRKRISPSRSSSQSSVSGAWRTLWTEEETWYDSIVESIPSAFTAVSPGLIPAPSHRRRAAQLPHRPAHAEERLFPVGPGGEAFRLKLELRLEKDAGPLDRLLQRLRRTAPPCPAPPPGRANPGIDAFTDSGKARNSCCSCRASPAVMRVAARSDAVPRYAMEMPGGRPCPPFPSPATPRNRSRIFLLPPGHLQKDALPRVERHVRPGRHDGAFPRFPGDAYRDGPVGHEGKDVGLDEVADLQAQPLSRGRQ